MQRFDLYGELRTAKDALALLLLMDDEDKRKEIKVVLQVAEAERKRLNEAIEVYGKVKEIETLVNKAKTDAVEATRVLFEARNEAATLQAAAKAKLADAEQEFSEREQAVAAGEKQISNRESQLVKGQEESQRVLAEAKADLDRRDKALAGRAAELDSLEGELKEWATRLKSASKR